MADLKASFMESYLSQQLSAVDGNHIIPQTPIPTEEELEQFKTYVKNYIEVDNDIKKLKAAVRDRNAIKSQITSYIVSFMSKFNIEDLNTKQGKIRYKITNVKKPLTEKTIKTKLLENFSPQITPEDLSQKIFGERATIKKHTLSRIIPK